MDFSANQEFIKMLELIASQIELRQMIYAIALMVWSVSIIKVIRWW